MRIVSLPRIAAEIRRHARKIVPSEQRIGKRDVGIIGRTTAYFEGGEYKAITLYITTKELDFFVAMYWTNDKEVRVEYCSTPDRSSRLQVALENIVENEIPWTDYGEVLFTIEKMP